MRQASGDTMQDYIYSFIAFLAMVIHLIINFDMLPGRKVSNVHCAREYRIFLAGVFIYYIVDAGWGILAGLGWTGVLYVDTMLYYLAIAVSVLTLCHFVIAYLGIRGWTARLLSWFGYALLVLYIVLLAANIFNNCLFLFDEKGDYSAGPLRHLIFYPLVVLIVLMAVFVFMKTLACRDSARRRYVAVFLFCITMAVAVFLQIVWPLWPFYALGCLVGNCFFHVFVLQDERDEQQKAAIEHEQTAKHMAELEMALERARAAEKARSLFFSTVSHDIRTPLNAIIGYSELLIGGIADEQERTKALSAISTSGHTLLQLINDVLDLSKLESGKMVIKPEPTDIRKLVSSVLHSFDVIVKDSRVELKEEYGAMPLLEIDPQRIRQILFNLIGNAVKFTEHGEIRVKTSFREIITGGGGGVFTLSVSDTGCGIPTEVKDKLMNPFVQVDSDAKIKGTGLGLAICKQLADRMGGQLSFVSELGKGSTFTIELHDVKTAGPLSDAESGVVAGQEPAGSQMRTDDTMPTGEPQEGRKDRKDLRILIADDVPLNLAVLKALLAKTGMRDVVTAVDGADAWEKLRTSEKPFDLILTDMWMPKMDGKGLAAMIRGDERFAGLPVYVVTADIESQKTFAEQGFTGVLLKPLTTDKLSALFR